VLHLMGCALIRLGRPLLGTNALEAAMMRDPGALALRIDYAVALLGCGRNEQAMATLLDARAHRPIAPALVRRLLPLLRESGRHAECLALLHDVVADHPASVPMRCELAMELASLLRLDEAMIHLGVADYLEPDNAAIQTNIGIILQARGDVEGAARRHRRALDLAPDSSVPHLNLATALLTGFDLEGGFAALEHRPLPEYPAPLPPRWRGEPLDGKRLLVLAEQGLGDMIQFARFLPALAARGGTVVVCCPAELVRLLRTLPVEVQPIEAGLPAADLWLPFLSLPAMLKPDLATLAGLVPYLSADPEHRVELPAATGLRVGLVWAAGASIAPTYSGRSLARRSCPLECVAPLAAIDGVTLFSLQKGPETARLAASGLPIHAMSDRLVDLADTAAAIAALDLVISVDTSVAHLAGAMGKPVWLLLGPGQADFRWGAGTVGTPWYPQARLFRCTMAGWSDLIGGVAAELAALAQGGGRLFCA
jgi:hypothetical protein